MQLFSDKTVYQEGEQVPLYLNITNTADTDQKLQVKGKALIGDRGVEIECYDLTVPKNQSSIYEIATMPATFTNSPTQSLSTFYYCGGMQMQSTKTQATNQVQNASKTQENFDIAPFQATYTQNSTEEQVQTNNLTITVIAATNQSQEENQEQNQEQSEQNSEQDQQQSQQQSQNTNPSPNTNPNSNLTQQQQSNIANNQQNQQTINQLKQQIDKEENINPDDEEKDNEKTNIYIFSALALIAALLIALYFYIGKQTPEEEPARTPEEIPRYITLLEEVKKQKESKEKASLISLSIREYVKVQHNKKKDLTSSEARQFCEEELLKDILKQTDEVEFTGKKGDLDSAKAVKDLKKFYSKNAI